MIIHSLITAKEKSNAYGYFPAQGYQYQPQQNFQPNQNQVPMIRGGIVNGEADIYPNMVFQDGSTSYFPVKDGSAIYAKAWKQDGSIATVKYIPEPISTTPKEDPYAAVFAQISERLSKIEKALIE